jgi:error-prone DNA polymerase
MLPDYAELHCLSNFTFLRGASHAEELVKRAHVLGYKAIAITDECSFAGSARAHVAAKEVGIKLVHGTEMKLTNDIRLVFLACNRQGYGNLSALVTLARRRAEKGTYEVQPGDFEPLTPWGALPDCLALWLPDAVPDYDQGRWVAQRFPGRAWIAYERHVLPDDLQRLARVRAAGAELNLPLVAAGDVHMHTKRRRALQDALTALRLNTTVFQAGFALHPNAERALRQRVKLASLYPADLLAETVRIADRCNFSLGELRYEYPDEIMPAGMTAASYLRQATYEGLQIRYPKGTPESVITRIEHELTLIGELAFEPYFLTVFDIVRYARGQGILCQGRGSAANSSVCYALGITEVDPARSSLLFERFMSKARNEPPDIDVDFEHDRREEVFQYIYRRYGRDRAAITATVICYRTRGAVRDAGRALGFGLSQIDALTKSMAWWDSRDELPERLIAAGLNPKSARVAKWLKLADELMGFPRHLSQHVGGFVISRGPLSRLVPIENAAMPERSVIQWDKDDLDAMGLLKIDVLALGMLSAIRRALEGVSECMQRPIRMQDIPAEDPATYRMVQKADTVGVFQIESRAQMSMLPRLKPKCFYDLVVQVAIVRPGPIQGDMVHPYLRRRDGTDPITYPSEDVRAVLERTLGVPIFQEQAMQLSMVAAGFTADEADALRRAMAAWKRKGGIGPFEAKLINGMLERGYSSEFAYGLFRQLEGFASYGFPESHAASFALLVYASAWLKCHFPAVFVTALLNSQPMGFYASAQLVQDAKRHGVRVEPVDVTQSTWDSHLIFDGPNRRRPAVRLGLREIKGFSEIAAQRIEGARMSAVFRSVDDLAARANMNAGDLRMLAHANALSTLAGHRREAAWQAAGVFVQRDLFEGIARQEAVPMLAAPTEGENIIADYESVRLTLGKHPLTLLRKHLTKRRFIDAASVNGSGDRALARVAGVVTCRQRPGTASGVIFITMEDETGIVNVVAYPGLLDGFRKELLGASLLGVYGQVQRAGDVVHVVAKRLVDLTELMGQLSVGSRDFH